MLDTNIVVVDVPEYSTNTTNKRRKLLESNYLQEVLERGTTTTDTNAQ